MHACRVKPQQDSSAVGSHEDFLHVRQELDRCQDFNQVPVDQIAALAWELSSPSWVLRAFYPGQMQALFGACSKFSLEIGETQNH